MTTQTNTNALAADLYRAGMLELHRMRPWRAQLADNGLDDTALLDLVLVGLAKRHPEAHAHVEEIVRALVASVTGKAA